GLAPVAIQSVVLHSIAVAMLPGLLIIFAPNPGFRHCVAAPGATFCRPASGAQSLPRLRRGELSKCAI
ncbi:MAG: hypothetical protein IKV82_07275, partial [Akkermansia sp.]|nr:hypothetical protein [Akkermansia sp.]